MPTPRGAGCNVAWADEWRGAVKRLSVRARPQVSAKGLTLRIELDHFTVSLHCPLCRARKRLGHADSAGWVRDLQIDGRGDAGQEDRT
mmetsp:Transcript_84611/g.262814  ORF Transcript_84611/g.262814 Transcript_84611/m.262814 type:complete len:88 (-) Transcript_84611:66-329(-)